MAPESKPIAQVVEDCRQSVEACPDYRRSSPERRQQRRGCGHCLCVLVEPDDP